MIQHPDRFAHHYWDQVLAKTSRGDPMDTWRAYMQRVYKRLLLDWSPSDKHGRGLKTDLFEEALSPHHLLPDLGPGSVGVDCSFAVVRAAKERLSKRSTQYLLMVGDLRQIPLQSEAVEFVVSGSSLDHFPDKAEIATSLAELARVLAPGGTLVITFDNPQNPVVWLRNHLPVVWLNRLGLVPYYVGATYNRVEARQQLEALGLVVTHVTSVVHAPRILAIWLGALAERLGWASLKTLMAGIFDGFENLGRWPTRLRTGYYLALRAEKKVPLRDGSRRERVRS
ncbi:MAG: class I SAM-dependent methyltransferase [Nitrospinota bacterium]